MELRWKWNLSHGIIKVHVPREKVAIKLFKVKILPEKLSVHLRFDGDGPNRFINAHHNYRLHVFFRCFKPKIAMIFATQDTHVVFSQTAWSNRGTTFRTTWWRQKKACWSNVTEFTVGGESRIRPLFWEFWEWRMTQVTLRQMTHIPHAAPRASCDVTSRAPCVVTARATSRAFWGSLAFWRSW